jgi:hypothetical protein
MTWNRVTTLSFVLFSPQPQNKMNSCWSFPCEMINWMPGLCLWSLPLSLSTVNSHNGPRSSDVPIQPKSIHAVTYHSQKIRTHPYTFWCPSRRSVLLPYSLTVRSFRNFGPLSSIVTDLVLIYESATSSVSDVRWLTRHSWTLNHDGTLTDLRINHAFSLSTMVRTEYRTLPSTVHVIRCFIRCRVNAR